MTQEGNPDTQHDSAIDVIKGIAILMVVMIHASETVLNDMTSLQTDSVLALIANCLSRVCVPWFVICSGFLLLPPEKNVNLLQFYKKRLSRILVPFAFWIAFYFLWRIWHHHQSFTPLQLLTLTIEGPVYYHLWFFYMLFGLYLACPFLSRMLENLSNREVVCFLGLWFLLASIRPWAEWVLDIKVATPLGIFGSYFGYIVFGGWARRLQPGQKSLSACVGTIFVAIIVTVTGSLWICRRDQGFNQVFLTYLAPNIVLLSLCSWQWLYRQATWPKTRARMFLTRVGKRSLGIYAAHIVILQSMDRLIPLNSAYPIRFLAIFAATFAVTILLLKPTELYPPLTRITG